jgi:hypothetical protein
LEHDVKIWGKTFTVKVYQKSKSVWIAVGDYMGKNISAQDRSESAALTRWREAATYQGNL